MSFFQKLVNIFRPRKKPADWLENANRDTTPTPPITLDPDSRLNS